ncbi:MAG: type VI secretion system contractile sheath large subunit [Alphaproteobacteria bacterium CG_4_10_14_0_2_um_filter_63_37]|nr:MAG: type VI secretion system-associated protein [Proteobacteria bacterium CG1_02_64_396]PJA25491.1 MAG: type VI secretion system contractile sheath large subunit [Alphaproteobacteria bacterium CG_4_10_14_0_2_um_filter_63_37]
MLGSVQDKLTRVRPPRVKITYDVETGGALQKKELPFIIGIFADLSGDSASELLPVKDRKMVEIDRDNFNAVLKSCKPRIKLAPVPNVLGGTGNLSGLLTFGDLTHFEPLSLVSRPDWGEIPGDGTNPATPAVNPFKVWYDRRCRIRDLQTKVEVSDAVAKLLDLAVTIGTEGDALRGKFTTAFTGDDPTVWRGVTAADEVATLAELIGGDPAATLAMLGQLTVDVLANITAANIPDEDPRRGWSAGQFMDARTAEIDALVAKQLNLVMHDQQFKDLEATWRGMFYLISRAETGTMLKLRVLNISRDDLYKDLTKAVEFDQSAVFKKIYEAEYGTYGGAPYSMLLGDYRFGSSPQDITLLDKIAEVAAASHAPFVAAAAPGLFGLGNFEALAKPRDLAKIFENTELTEWRGFRDSEDSRYVSLVLPDVLLRLPYGDKTNPVEGIRFEEDVGSVDEWSLPPAGTPDTALEPDSTKFLWGNAAYLLANRVTTAFSLYGWTAAIRGVEGGGLVRGLPAFNFKTGEGDVAMICPTQVAITDRREKEINDLGFMALCHCKGTNQAVFFGGQTTNKPKQYISDLANANAQVSSMLPYILSASRFAHYIKVIMREKVGSFMTRSNVESYLNSWIAQYVLLDDEAPQDVKASYPLRAAKISVTDVPGKPGAYKATIFLKPHFQLEELTTSIRLVADLPA